METKKRHISPSFTASHVESFLADRYNIKVSATPLGSYKDQNFLVETADSNRFVFKISDTSEPEDFIRARHRISSLLQQHKISCPRIVPDRKGERLVTIVSEENIPFHAWLITFIEGRLLSEISPRPEKLLSNLGAFLGKMDLALQYIDHPSLHRYLIWDISNCLDLRQNTDFIRNKEDRNLVYHF